MMPAVDEMEASPVRNAHRPQHEMRVAPCRAEVLLCTCEDRIHCAESGGYLREEIVGCRRGQRGSCIWIYFGRSLVSPGNPAELQDEEAGDPLLSGCGRLRGMALLEPNFNRSCGRGVGENEMLDDLMNGPGSRLFRGAGLEIDGS